MATSTLTPQQLVDYGRAFSWTAPVLSVAGYGDQPALSFCDDIVKKIMAKSNPWKWNMIRAAVFYTNPYQQDYPTSISQNAMGWLANCTMIDINNPTNPPVQPPLTVVQNLLPTSNVGYPTKICWIPNNLAITGRWQANAVYTNPVAPGVTGADGLVGSGGPSNNLPTAIKDPNGNIQLVTTYGTTGATAPTWPAAASAAGVTTTDGSVVWTVQDSNGIAFRFDQMATFGSTVFEVHPIYQNKPPNMTSLSQTFAPIPDDLDYLIRQGFLAWCYKHTDNAKFQIEYAQWLEDIQMAMGGSDRELQEFGIYPSNAVQGAGGGMTGGYGYPGWWGWNSDGN